ncbi:tetratricopeptide repeat protein [Aquirufa sp. KTFRIE-69F]|uniref:Tetratricopeptide repeat protein n=1 Tax=Aquirufa originis TaxID=3096514 RepID=A0ABW6D7R0_9BACT
MRKLTCLLFLLCGFLRVSAQSEVLPEALMVDGMRAYMKEDFGEAILVFEKLAKVQTQEPAVFYYLAKSYLADKQLTSARTNAEKAHLLSPYSFDYGLLYGDLLLANKEYKKALACFENLLAYDDHRFDNEPDMIRVKQFVFLSKGDEAKETADKNAYYLQAANLGPVQEELWVRIIQLDWELNRKEAVVEHALEALDNYPRMAPWVYPILGDAYQALGNNSASDAAFDKALAANPKDDHVLNNYSYFLSIRKEKLALADTLSARLVADHPKNGTYLDTRAWVLFELKRYPEARIAMEAALKDKENASATLWEHYGDVLFRLKLVEKALDAWKEALRLDPSRESVDKKIRMRQIPEN